MIRKTILGVAMAAILASCSSNNATTGDVSNTVTSGNWRVSYYNDSGTDETYHFAGYSFVFGTNGVLTASNGTNTYTGSWSVTDSNSNDDSLSDLDFNIFFSAPAEFEDLTDDWDIKSFTSTKIELEDVSGGGSGTDRLTFEKN
jgi:hypothetical protein